MPKLLWSLPNLFSWLTPALPFRYQLKHHFPLSSRTASPWHRVSQVCFFTSYLVSNYLFIVCLPSVGCELNEDNRKQNLFGKLCRLPCGVGGVAPRPSPKDELWCIYSSQLAYPFFQALVFGSGKRTWLGQPKQSEPGRTHWGGISTDLFSPPGQPKYSEPVSGTTTASMVTVKQGTKGKRS